MAYLSNEILVGNKKEGCADTCYKKDELWKQYTKWKEARHKRPYVMWFHLYEMSTKYKSWETDSR